MLFILFEYGADRGGKGGEFVFDYVPHDFRINAEVFMDEKVPEACKFKPFHHWLWFNHSVIATPGRG